MTGVQTCALPICYSLKIFRSDFNTPDLLKNNSITCITEDSEQRIWFGTKRGIYIIDKKDYSIVQPRDIGMNDWFINAIYATSDGFVWVSSNNMLFRFGTDYEIAKTYPVTNGGYIRPIESFYEDPEGILWITQKKGSLLSYDKVKDNFIEYEWPYDSWPTSIIKDKDDDCYWVATSQDGVIRFSPRGNGLTEIYKEQPETLNPDNYMQNAIVSIIQDNKRGYIWTLTLDDIYAYEINEKKDLIKFDVSEIIDNGKKIIGSSVSDKNGNIWVAGFNPQSFIISFSDEVITRNHLNVFKERNGFPATIDMMIYDNDFLWIWTKRNSIALYNPENNDIEFVDFGRRRISPFWEKSKRNPGIYCVLKDLVVLNMYRDEKNKIKTREIVDISDYIEKGEYIRSLYEDEKGDLFIGTSNNLYVYYSDNCELKRLLNNTGFIMTVLVAENQDIYVLSETNGIYILKENAESEMLKSDEEYINIASSKDKTIWLATKQGSIHKYNPENGNIISLTEACGLTGDFIYDIKTDEENNLWILTDQKVIIYNPEKNICRDIKTSSPGINMNNFRSMILANHGITYIGGSDGYFSYKYSFKDSQEEDHEFPVRITSIRINKEEYISGLEDNLLKLGASERDIQISVSSFDQLHADKIRFAYRLSKSEWIYLQQGQNNIYLTQLKNGRHELEIKFADSNGKWNDEIKRITIYCEPSWYESNTAFIIYAVFILLLSYIIIRLYIKRKHERNLIKMEKDMSNMKYSFFTNISHEIRTPLSLIISPLDSLIKQTSDSEISNKLHVIKKNASNLLSITNQLLDFRKMESGKENLVLTKGDIVEFVNSIYYNFRLLAVEKDMRYSFETEYDSLYMNFDKEKINKVVTNLLSNAFKFTETRGCIEVRLRIENISDRKYCVIDVFDNGIGISPKYKDMIFERFHQVNIEDSREGSGIGLYLVKEYITMHEGEVKVKSIKDEYSIFTFMIPVDLEKDDIPEENHNFNKVENLISSDDKENRPKILLIEDNRDFRNYLKSELCKSYSVFESDNGLDGENKILNLLPDIIITDLMMPGIDGLELCRRIKNNIKVSHIPVILLTASMDTQNERQGYIEGVEAFISKPFDLEILLLRIGNIINSKITHQISFKTDLTVDTTKLTNSGIDDQFMKKVISYIENNMDNPDYTVEDLSSDLAMSRSSLFRKIKAITDMSPMDLVKNIRLKHGAKLLLEGEFAISEVGYKIGYASPSHFTRAFKNMFGISPTQFQQEKGKISSP